ncbi:hypothetical protein HK101_011948, partial [Irineochytrium annulatum]
MRTHYQHYDHYDILLGDPPASAPGAGGDPAGTQLVKASGHHQHQPHHHPPHHHHPHQPSTRRLAPLNVDVQTATRPVTATVSINAARGRLAEDVVVHLGRSHNDRGGRELELAAEMHLAAVRERAADAERHQIEAVREALRVEGRVGESVRTLEGCLKDEARMRRYTPLSYSCCAQHVGNNVFDNSALESNLDSLTTHLHQLQRHLQHLSSHLDAAQHRLSASHAALAADLRAAVSESHASLAAHVGAELARLHGRLDALEGRTDSLERRVGDAVRGGGEAMEVARLA